MPLFYRPKMKVLVCGDRNYKDYSKIYSVLVALPGDAFIIQGGAKGADWLAKKAAKELKLKVKEYKADWLRYGQAAGPIRNIYMLDKESPDCVYAFHSNLKSSKGTAHMVNLARRRGIPVKVID